MAQYVGSELVDEIQIHFISVIIDVVCYMPDETS